MKCCVPEVAIKAVAKQLQLPSLNEGFDKLYQVQWQQEQFMISEWGDADEIR